MFRHTSRLGALLLLSTIPLVFACEDDPVGPEDYGFEGAEKIAIPGSVTLEVGQAIWLTLAQMDKEGAKRQIKWSSSDPSVARVSGRGLVQALAKGSATITADCGSYCVSARVTVVLARGD